MKTILMLHHVFKMLSWVFLGISLATFLFIDKIMSYYFFFLAMGAGALFFVTEVYRDKEKEKKQEDSNLIKFDMEVK